MNLHKNHPMSEYLMKIQLLVTNTEFKNKEIANQYETIESKLKGDAYVRAKLGTDLFESYDWDEVELTRMLDQFHFTPTQIEAMIKNPSMIPQSAMNLIMKAKRDAFIEAYKEPNKYYVNLMGLPFEGNENVPADPLITVPTEFYNAYKETYAFGEDSLVYELPEKYMELFLSSTSYRALLRQYPDVEYLKHLGSYAIPLEISRPAHDGDILTINTSKLHVYHQIFGDVNVSSDMIHLFTTIYKKTHDYVYFTLRGDFEMIYANYNSFIRFLTIYMTIGNMLNECMKRSSSLIYMNNEIMNDYFQLYGLPSVIMDNSDTMVEFLKKFRLLLMDKGTNTVYRVKDIIGYEYTDIYTLIMVKQQAFENGKPIYYIDENGKRKPKQDIVFRRFGTAEDNTSYFKFRDETKEYSLEEITSGDPRWWNTPEVESMIQDMNYTLSNSKYIQLSTHMSMDDIWWQCSVLLRGLLDNREETKSIMINLDTNFGGIQSLPVFDAILSLIVMMNWKHTDFLGNHFRGNLQIPNGTYNGEPACLDLLFLGNGADPHDRELGIPYMISSFNFDLHSTDEAYYDSLPFKEFLIPDEFIPMLDHILNRTTPNIGETLMYEIRDLYKYLMSRLFEAKTIHEFRQVDEAYNKLFLVDSLRTKWFDGVDETSVDIIINNYGFSKEEFDGFVYFLHENDNTTIDVEYDGQKYSTTAYKLLSTDAKRIGRFPLKDEAFLQEFLKELSTWTDNVIASADFLNQTFCTQYRDIIRDKVLLDLSDTEYGPATFDALLLRTNPLLHKNITAMKSNPESIVIAIRSIVRALETYTSSELTALLMQSLGASEYINILKEVITYFKSYMVEFTKEEFTYIFGGPFDQGGNSDMLHLYDEIAHIKFHMLPHDVLKLHDVSHMTLKYGMVENRDRFLYDDALFRVKTTYQNLVNKGYDIWYDDGESISEMPYHVIQPSNIVVGTLMYDKNKSKYAVLIPANNINPDDYYGNTRP